MQNDGVLRMPMPSRAGVSAPSAIASVEIHRSADTILDIWADFETLAPCSIYQTRAWLVPWIETLGRKADLDPFFVLARGRDERPVALLCLGLTRIGPFKVATWLGGKDSNFNMPLVRPGVSWTRGDVRALFREATRAAGDDGPDAFVLSNQPFGWSDQSNPMEANPLALIRHQTSPSAAYGTALPADAESLFANKLSKDTRKKLRKKENKLAALGPVTHQIATTAEQQAAMIDTFLALKIQRFRAQKIPSEFESVEMRAFIEAASAPRGAGIELHALQAGERIVALYGGAAFGGQWSGMFNAFDTDEEIARSSPGDLLLMKVMAKACADGLTRFDLGIGEARYKAAFCDEIIPLFDTIMAMSLRGHVFSRAYAMRQRLKRSVKGNTRLLSFAKRMRALKPIQSR